MMVYGFKAKGMLLKCMSLICVGGHYLQTIPMVRTVHATVNIRVFAMGLVTVKLVKPMATVLKMTNLVCFVTSNVNVLMVQFVILHLVTACAYLDSLEKPVQPQSMR